MPESVSLDAPAKVNLRLKILAREASGYHALETVFCALSLADRVTVSRAAGGMALEVAGGVDTGPPERNLAVRAARRFYVELGRDPAIQVRVEKRIPAAAGLGGGSSDAAAVLRALNALEAEPFDSAALLQMAIELGADVPFFLCGSPLALAWSRGERLLALPPLPARPVLVAHPGTAVSTAEAFAAIAASRDPAAPPAAFGFPLETLTRWDGVAGMAENDFQRDLVGRIPVLDPALDALSAAQVSLLAGSGGCVFGVFAEASARDAARPLLEGLGMACWSCETLAAMPRPRVDRSESVG
jgi:4-diphosphocytidyl-2-C-methyl-D-erythritol kinase